MLRKKKSSVVYAASFLVTALLLFSGCKPYITNVVPYQGEVGDNVTIKGGRFGNTPTSNTVKFANTSVPATDISVVSTSELKVKVPVGAVTGLVSVKTNKGIGKSKKNFSVEILNGAKWTIMVYLDADNNLEFAGIDDFLEMSSVGSKNGVNIIVQMDRIGGYSTDHGDWTGTRRFLIKQGDTPSSAPLEYMGELNMGDPNVLRDFVEWSITNYPAEHYALSIWNHGDGWRKNMEKMDSLITLKRSDNENILVKGVCSDNTDLDILYTREVQDALTDARRNLESRNMTNVKIDLLGFDACLMGMIEVAYALRDNVNYMVGSEETEPGDGWPYDRILSDLTNSPTMTPENLAKTIVNRYGNSYLSGVTQAAYDMSKLNGLVARIDSFAKAATAEWAALKTARNNSRQYHSCMYSCWGTDLWDFADKVYNNCNSPNIKNAASTLKASIDNFVVKEFHSSNMSGSHGVAIYFPPNIASFNNDPQHSGYEESNTTMPVDFVSHHQFDNWLKNFYANIP